MKPMRANIYKFVIPALLMAGLLSIEFAFASGPTCSMIFSEQSSIDRTIHDLASMRISLDQAKAKGANSIELTALTSVYRKKEQALFEYFETNKIMTRQDLAEVMKQEIQKIQNEQQGDQRNEALKKDEEARRRKDQEEHIKNSSIDGKHVVMHRVEPGTFKMGEVGKQVEMTITEPFDMQATPMTQIMWRTVVELVDQALPRKYVIIHNPSSFRGDTHPVVEVSLVDIRVWLEALNELSAMGEPALAALIPGHKKGDVYRLPTGAEWEFVVRGRGQYNDTYHFGNDASQLGEYAWYRHSSDNRTEPVAQKKPLVIGNKYFYDMHGNVWEHMQDGTLRGGSWYAGASNLHSGLFLAARLSHDRGADTGFRLVRTVP